MSGQQDKPPDSPSPRLSMGGWMKVSEQNVVGQMAKSPVRSGLLQNSSKSVSALNLTKGQISRFQIADKVRFVLLQ